MSVAFRIQLPALIAQPQPPADVWIHQQQATMGMGQNKPQGKAVENFRLGLGGTGLPFTFDIRCFEPCRMPGLSLREACGFLQHSTHACMQGERERKKTKTKENHAIISRTLY